MALVLVALNVFVGIAVVAIAAYAAHKVTAASRADEINAREVSLYFDRLKDSLEGFRNAATAAQKENSGISRELKVQLEEVGRRAQSLGRQADEFVTALKGGNKVQGNWGEGILSKVLEDAGLVKGVNFVAQEGSRETGLPDVRVFDGEGHEIVIDAKVNVTGFIAAENAARAGDAAEADRLLKAHAKSVRTQIGGLAARRYAALVIMFMPSEATYAAALSADPSLAAFANASGVVLASPQMLFGYLVLFKMGLARQQVDRNNAEIAKRAEQIIARADAAFAALDKVGKALDDANAKYHEALAKLGKEEGAQNVLTPAKELIRLTNSTARRNAKLLQE